MGDIVLISMICFAVLGIASWVYLFCYRKTPPPVIPKKKPGDEDLLL